MNTVLPARDSPVTPNRITGAGKAAASIPRQTSSTRSETPKNLLPHNQPLHKHAADQK